ncbi:MAG TPA: DoxX family protein [Candidatus Baltobacteraceae bacterium]|jgi:hypothetical protein|nr:DoxX family protein [Candidatus Baltobacteraceae bacterium]
MHIAATVIGVLLALAFLVIGGAKIAGVSTMREAASHFGIPYNTYRAIGVLEIAGALGVLIGFVNKALGIAAGIGLFLLLIGAVASHLRVRDPFVKLLPALVLGVLAVAYVWLRITM